MAGHCRGRGHPHKGLQQVTQGLNRAASERQIDRPPCRKSLVIVYLVGYGRKGEEGERKKQRGSREKREGREIQQPPLQKRN